MTLVASLVLKRVKKIFLLQLEVGIRLMCRQGILKGGSITVLLTSCLTDSDYSVLQIITNIVSCHTADSKPVKQEVNGTVIRPPLVFPGVEYARSRPQSQLQHQV